MTETLTLLAAQIDVPVMKTSADRDRHVDRVAMALDQSLTRDGRVDLVVLPELSTLDYAQDCFDHLDDLAENLNDSPSLKRFGHVASNHETPVLVGMARRGDDGNNFISQVLLGADGAVKGCYDKLHIAQFGDSAEKAYFTRGDHVLVFDINGFTLGVTICYDMRSPELSRHLVRHHGVDVILHPTAFCRDETFATWHAFATTRAVENQVYFASVNRAGENFGASVLMNPWIDETVVNPVLGVREEFARWQLARSVLHQARSGYPFLKDARDDYHTL